jgi:hypothetical protein
MQLSSTHGVPALHPKRRIVGLWVGVVGALICVAVIVALIVTWPDHGHGAVRVGVDPAAVKQQGNGDASDAATASARP